MNIQDTIQAIKNSGFTHAKAEFEANLERANVNACEWCDGSGRIACDNCAGSGELELEDDNGNYYIVECGNCYGDSDEDCFECSGSGEDDTAIDWQEEVEKNLTEEEKNKIVYRRFYNDGSVDSEYTVTVKVEDIEILVKLLKGFKKLEDITGHFDVTGAGMHLSIMNSGNYPVGCTELNFEKLQNFKEQMNRLMPALFFFGSSGNTSRALGYRKPQASSSKYSAINTGHDGVLEYRVFEMCHEKPEMLLQNFAVIAKSLKYFDNPKLKVKPLDKVFGFTSERGGNYSLERFYSSKDNLEVLNAQLNKLLPEGMTVSEAKKERNFTMNGHKLNALAKKNKDRIEQIAEAWLKKVKESNTMLDEEQVQRRLDALTELASQVENADSRIRV